MPKVITSDAVFKKAEVVVGRPPTTDHDINDEYIKNPPHNGDHSKNEHKQVYRHGGHKDMNEAEKILADEGAAELGRANKEEELAEIAQEDSVHS